MAADNGPLQEQPFFSHLLELRDRLLRMVLAVLVLLLVLFPFGNDIFTVLSQPVVDALPEGSSMLATKVLSPFLTPLKLAFVAALFLAMPFLLYQLWGFIAPGLYAHEKQLAFPMLASSIVLFYLGAAFAYFVVLPLLFPFLVGVVPENVEVAPDIADFLDVAIKLFFAFGLAFEVPIATILLVVTGMTTPETLSGKRPYVIVGAFVVGMLLTPPDVISQTLLAVPVWFLFEVGIVFARIFHRRKKAGQAEEDEIDPDSVETVPQPAAAAAGAGAGVAAADDGEAFVPMSEAEMEDELDRIEAEEDDDGEYDESDSGDDDEAPDDAAAEQGGDAPLEGLNGPGPDDDELSATDEVPPGEDDDAFAPPEDDTAPVDHEARAAVVAKLERVMQLREEMRLDEARKLLYEVLVEGNETQVRVARNILEQLDG